ncbi:hypothetical protein C9I56_11190 [Paraburkholderia caribensis]|uniref:packaged DNA stabilization gp4 family protein n=1 Tax=Paraburkholderia caribensis TaxID=75105 RepID=UPI000D16BCD5|nr:packaged DNA stabilization gp4 family protein [Paraburkholderia caribensis]PTB28847.1 hypothetical protein C9I56_11190 [Paraburkholderia caribensis]
MTTKIEIVNEAYAQLGLANYVFDLQPEEITTGIRRLDRMMAQWDAAGIRIGYNLPPEASVSNANDIINVPDWAEQAMIYGVALLIAPTIPKVPTPDLRKSAQDSYDVLLYGNYEIPQMQMPRHMPIGLGNRRNTKNQQFFAPVDRVTTTNDALLEPSGNPWPDSN